MIFWCRNFLTVDNAKLRRDNTALKKLVDSSKTVNLYKDIQIQKLKSKNGNEVCSDNVTLQSKLLFAKHAGNFTAEQLRSLRSIGKGQKCDTTFIGKCLDYLYDGNVQTIAGKCGGDKKMKGKALITPPKKLLMETMLNERIESEGVTTEVNIERIRRLNRMIGDSIYSVARRNNRSQSSSRDTLTPSDFTAIPPQPVSMTMITQTITNQMMTQHPEQGTHVPASFAVTNTDQPFDAFNFVSLTPVTCFAPNTQNVFFQ